MERQTIGSIGLGIMGSAVSANLLQDGFEVVAVFH
jgi:3-hydroxyisobutyrate dehydrogenase-like beta-hydroxyacid dehydrogenase